MQRSDNPQAHIHSLHGPWMDINSKPFDYATESIPTLTTTQSQPLFRHNLQNNPPTDRNINANPTRTVHAHSTTNHAMDPSTCSNASNNQHLKDVDSGYENEGSGLSTPNTTPSVTPSKLIHTLNRHNMTTADLQNVHDLFVEIARECGKIMIQAEHEVLEAAGQKKNSSDIVTVYDAKIEVMAQERIKAAYADFDFFGEETHKEGTKLGDGPTVVCDPIDGTLNFRKGVPNCAISLGLTLDKKPVVGVVYNPFRGDMYTAIKNRGAFLTNATGTRIPLPQHAVAPPMPDLRSCLLCIEWGNERSGPNWETRLHVHNKLLTSEIEGGAMCKSIRSNGSAALDFCHVAHGYLDAFWEGGVYVWDVCAGWIILEEAGGMVASANPGDWEPTLEGRVYFAVRRAKREEQEGVVRALWDIMGDRRFVFANSAS